MLLYRRLLSGTVNQEKPVSDDKSKDDSGQGKESGGEQEQKSASGGKSVRGSVCI